MGAPIALDSNLTLLLVVGRAESGLIERNKRLRAFGQVDYDLLCGFILHADGVVTTPNAMTEVSNIATFGIREPSSSRIVASLRAFVSQVGEAYCPSRQLAGSDEFSRLGLADCAWFPVMDAGAQLLTIDNGLYLAALGRGFEAVNFEHVRASYRRI